MVNTIKIYSGKWQQLKTSILKCAPISHSISTFGLGFLEYWGLLQSDDDHNMLQFCYNNYCPILPSICGRPLWSFAVNPFTMAQRVCLHQALWSRWHEWPEALCMLNPERAGCGWGEWGQWEDLRRKCGTCGEILSLIFQPAHSLPVLRLQTGIVPKRLPRWPRRPPGILLTNTYWLSVPPSSHSMQHILLVRLHDITWQEPGLGG